jgi:sarcosine oxidase gamma subunit
MSGQTLEVVEVAQSSCFELVEVNSGLGQQPRTAISSPGGSLAWPKIPGAVRVAADGRLEALYFAPGRWLLPAPSADLLAAMADQPEAMLVDVGGKWQRRSLRGDGAMRLLAAAADVEAMLTGRACASVVLFDCPAIVARGNGTIELWVQSSYARFLDEQLAHVLSRLARRRAP